MSTGRCRNCNQISNCPVCNVELNGFHHVGVRSSGLTNSSIWHYADPCGHKLEKSSLGASTVTANPQAVYNGGPVWKTGYQWFNVFWGSFWVANALVPMVNKAVEDIEKNTSYSGELKQYGVGIGTLNGYRVISQNPPQSVSSKDISTVLIDWIKTQNIPDFGGKGAYNIFLPKGVMATLSGDQSCVKFCDYHDTADGNQGPFFTCEPYPCTSGCNQCSTSSFDTLTQGLSEEMVELKTDMNPGTGWVIGNEEICDYCDTNFVCNRISSGEYVNAWYSNSLNGCWTPSR